VLTYTDYCRWQATHVTGSYHEQHLDYWRRLAAGYPATGIPLQARQETGAPPDYRAAAVAFTIQTPLVAAMRRLAWTQSTRLFPVLLGLFHVALARLTGTEDTLVGTATGNRNQPGTADAIGFLCSGTARACTRAENSSRKEPVRCGISLILATPARDWRMT